MNTTDLLSLLPWVLVSATVLVTMLQIAFRRSHGLSVVISVLGYTAALLSLCVSADYAPRQVTPLVVVDQYSLFFTGLLLVTALLVALFSYVYFQGRAALAPQLQLGEYYVLLACGTLGAMLTVAASHFLSFFLGLELLSVALFALIAYTSTQRQAGTHSLEAGIKYLILSGISSAILLFGMALLYAQVGSMSLAAMAQLLTAPAGQLNPLFVQGGLVLMLVGLGFKLSLAPFHLWTPDVYEGAPAPVTAYLATASKVAVFAFLLRYFQITESQVVPAIAIGLTAIAVISMLGGNLLALLQTNVKRMLAYSSIAHLGYLLVAFLATGSYATASVAFYLSAYTVITLGAFGVVGLLSSHSRLSSPGHELDTLDDYRSLLWERPALGWSFAIMLLALAGIPLTMGFIAKFYLLAAGVQDNLWLLVVVLVAGSAIGLFYYLRVIIVMSMPRVADSLAGQGKAAALADGQGSVLMLGGGVLALLTVVVVWLGVYPAALMQFIRGLSTALAG